MLKALMLGLKDAASPLIPSAWRHQLRQRINSLRSTEAVFTETYQKNLWGGEGVGDLHSGSGSRGPVADLHVAKMKEFSVANNISSVLDLGWGDFAIGKDISQVCLQYTGVDVVKIVIARNSNRFGSKKSALSARGHRARRIAECGLVSGPPGPAAPFK